VDIITTTENGLGGIKRTLTPQEEETVSQIKAFLTKAHEALKNNDLDGAHTLATKAKVLLDELNKT
jgi:phosphoribosylformimino-5-aminoimidazole carboxamide ribonucleotide (ProFAR) isomerase